MKQTCPKCGKKYLRKVSLNGLSLYIHQYKKIKNSSTKEITKKCLTIGR